MSKADFDFLLIFQSLANSDQYSWLYHTVKLNVTKMPSRSSVPCRLPPLSPFLYEYSGGATKLSIRRKTCKVFSLMLSNSLNFRFL